jgi:hypothetical protein
VVAALSGEAWAAIIAASFWALLVLFLALVLVNVFRLVESAKALVDGIRQETVPLLSEVKATVSALNRELDRVDGVVESAGRIVKHAERVSAVVEQAVSSPLVKAVAFGAGASRAVRRLRRRRD